MAIVTEPKKPRKAPDSGPANRILSALARYHEERGDIWMGEAEIGRKGIRVDLFTIKASWKPMPTIYEIKTSRADFFRDAKWTHYLPYCQRFYFATPPGLVRKEEVPDPRAGLVEVDANGQVILIKPCKIMVPPAKNLHLMLHRLLFKYAFPLGGTKPVQPHEWNPWKKDQR